MDEATVKDFISYLSLQKRASKHTVESYQNDLLEFFGFINSEISNIPITQFIIACLFITLSNHKGNKQ